MEAIPAKRLGKLLEPTRSRRKEHHPGSLVPCYDLFEAFLQDHAAGAVRQVLRLVDHHQIEWADIGSKEKLEPFLG
ncbi:hypothetical protein D3C87_2060720 [compost metagenome]